MLRGTGGGLEILTPNPLGVYYQLLSHCRDLEYAMKDVHTSMDHDDAALAVHQCRCASGSCLTAHMGTCQVGEHEACARCHIGKEHVDERVQQVA